MNIGFDFSNTLYLSQTYVKNIRTIGTNLPLIVSEYLATYINLKYGGYTAGDLSFLILLIALPAPKFIGPETVEIVQLMFFSLLLTNPI